MSPTPCLLFGLSVTAQQALSNFACDPTIERDKSVEIYCVIKDVGVQAWADILLMIPEQLTQYTETDIETVQRICFIDNLRCENTSLSSEELFAFVADYRAFVSAKQSQLWD